MTTDQKEPLCPACGTKMRAAGSCFVCEGCGSMSGVEPGSEFAQPPVKEAQDDELAYLINEVRSAVLFDTEYFENIGFNPNNWINVTGPTFSLEEAASSIASKLDDDTALVHLSYDRNPCDDDDASPEGGSLQVRIVEMRTLVTDDKNGEPVAHVRLYASRDDIAVREYIIWALTSFTPEGVPVPFSVFTWQKIDAQ